MAHMGNLDDDLAHNEENNAVTRPNVTSREETTWMDQPSTSSGVTQQHDRFCNVGMMMDLYDDKLNLGPDQEPETDIADENTELVATPNDESASELPTETSVSGEPVKRTRGRPRKNTSGIPTAPTRVSSRAKKPLEKFSMAKEKYRPVWSKEEKRQLIKGLEKFGAKNIKEIHTFVSTRSEYEIKSQIQFYQRLAHDKLQNRLLTERRATNRATVNCIKKLEDWIAAFEHLQKDSLTKQFALSIFFELASEYGKFSSKLEAGGIDFRALNRYIHCMLNSEPFYGMNPVTKKVLLDMLRCTDSLAQEYMRADLVGPQLHHYPVHREKERKTYPGSAKRGRYMTVGKLFNNPDTNPLKLPPHMLEIPGEIKRNSYSN